jgi:hypothetical protein
MQANLAVLRFITLAAISTSAMKVLQDSSADTRIGYRDVFEECGQNWLAHTGLDLQVKSPPQGTRIGESASFRVAEATGKSCEASDYTLWARMVGPSIIMATVEPSKTSCEWTVTYSADNAGDYNLELVAYWWSRGGPWNADRLNRDGGFCHAQRGKRFVGPLVHKKYDDRSGAGCGACAHISCERLL